MEKFVLLVIGLAIFGAQHYLSLKDQKWLGFIVPGLTVAAAAIIFTTRHCALTMENTLPFVLLIVFEVIIWFLDRNKNKTDAQKSKSDVMKDTKDNNNSKTA